MKIYILSTYAEYGAENVSATTDKSKVISMVKNIGIDISNKELIILKNLLKEDKVYKDGTDITSGWGGLMLHIVKAV